MLVDKWSRNIILEASAETAIFEERQTMFPPSVLNHVSKLHSELYAPNFFQLKDLT